MIAVCIPSIPPRATLLARALGSVCAQALQPDEIAVAVDHCRDGAARTRNRAWRMTTADRIAFLDDDDELLPEHLAKLDAFMDETGADLVYPWFEVVGGTDPFPQNYGRPWTLDEPIQTTITCLWRREALESVGGFPEIPAGPLMPDGHRRGEDYEAVLALAELDGTIAHLPEVTWRWHHDTGNTSGLPVW